MRVLWVCNIMLPCIAKALGQEVNNKEGWITGLMEAVLHFNRINPEREVQLAIAFPIAKEQAFLQGALPIHEDYDIPFYGFREDVLAAETYDLSIEADMAQIFTQFKPDMIHCFGTEYPHTLAAVKTFGKPERTLIGIQGLCKVYAGCYMANLPKDVRGHITFRDFLKKDWLKKQQEKFEERGHWELLAIKGAGHITGRTHWDKHWTNKWNPNATYHMMNETLRAEFYTGEWKKETCISHRIFLSQGDYPIKGLHYMLLALPEILKQYPDTKVCVAGNCILRKKNLIGKLKISAYGAYIQKLIEQYHLQDKVIFLGRLDAAEMKKAYLESNLFVCPSSIENSPNSLGEAMMLGVPVVTSDVGGICTMMAEDEGILYEGFRAELDTVENQLERISRRLADAVCEAFKHEEATLERAKKARAHAMKTHDGEINNRRLIEIYEDCICI